MATVIQIKRSTGSAAPSISDLSEGELAYVQDRSGSGANAKLYIESVDSDNATALIHAVGGKYFTDIVAGIKGSSGTAGRLKITEDSDNGAHGVTLVSPASLAADVSFTLPSTDGTSGQVIGTDASGNLSFISTTSTIAGATDTNFTSLADGHVAIYDNETSRWLNKAVSGDVTMSDTGVFTLGADVADGSNIADDSIAAEHLASNAVVFASVDGAAVITSVEGIASNSTSDVTFPTTKAVADLVASKDALSELTGDTDDVTEGTTNLYYTDARVNSHLSGGTGVTYTDGAIVIGQDVATSSNVTFANIETSGYLRGPASFTIDPAAFGDDTGTVVIAGNLQVDGSTTTINSTTVTIDDLNFSVATDALDSAAANGAGFSIGGASATILYAHADTSFNMNKPLNVTGNVASTGGLSGVGLALSGSITSVDGSALTAGQLLIGNGTAGDMEAATLTAGEGMTITNADGAITLTGEDSTAANKGIVIVEAGEGMDVSYASGTATITGEDATTGNKGIASFASANFTVTSGAVAITAIDGGTF